jgi:hypothetical protein
VGEAPNQHGARKFVNLHGLAEYTTSSHNHTACMQILSFRYREWQRHGHYLRGLSQPTILLKLLLLSMCNLPTRCWNWKGRVSYASNLVLCSLRFHFHVSKFGIAITPHLQWVGGYRMDQSFSLSSIFRVLCISIENSFLSCFPLCFC